MSQANVDLSSYRQTWSWKIKCARVAWNLIWAITGYFGPRRLSAWRVFLLRLFGAKIGKAVLISGRVKVLMPWNLIIGDYVAIAEQVNFYNFDNIKIGSNTTISQEVFLCTGTHDFRDPTFPLTWRPIAIGSGVWVAMKCLVLPGAQIADGAIVGAGSVVRGLIPPLTIWSGNPCTLLKNRINH